MDRPIQIIVKGERCTGKSLIVFLLKQFFRHLNIQVIHDYGNHNYRSEEQFDQMHERHFFETIDGICQRGQKTIIIKEDEFYSHEEFSSFMSKWEKNRRGRKIDMATYKPRKNSSNLDIFA